MEKERVELLLERSFLFDPNIYMTVVVTIEGEVGEEEICEDCSCCNSGTEQECE